MADDEVSNSGERDEHWFAKPGQEVLFYRVNRRPIGGEGALFTAHDDVLAHLRRVLATPTSASSGTKYHRTWRLGDLRFSDDPPAFTGRLGWARTREALAQTWDAEHQGWIDQVVPQTDSGVSPVAFDARSRVLGILKHPSFSTEPVLAKVLTHILNEGEMAQPFPTTEWSVEPLGDVSEFYSWLRKVDQLLVLRTVFKRPNPDAEESFRELHERLDALDAEQIRQEIRASDKTAGLNKAAVEADSTTQGFLVAALQYAFGRVWAKGRRRGKVVTYDQRRQVLRASLDDVGGSWDAATESVLQAVERRGRKQLAKLSDGTATE